MAIGPRGSRENENPQHSAGVSPASELILQRQEDSPANLKGKLRHFSPKAPIPLNASQKSSLIDFIYHFLTLGTVKILLQLLVKSD